MNFFRYLCFTLFAMVIPSQALAYLQQNTVEASHIQQDVDERTDTAQLTHFSTPITLNELPSDSANLGSPDITDTPSTNVEHTPKIIVGPNQWLLNSRSVEEHEHQEIDGDSPHCNPIPLYKSYIAPIYAITSWHGDVYASTYRLSGWKDTNALYVALNSQFSA